MTDDEIQSFLFKFMLATRFTAFCNSNVDSKDLFQHVIALIGFRCKRSQWHLSLIKILLAYTVYVFSFTIVLYAYRELLALCVYLSLQVLLYPNL